MLQIKYFIPQFLRDYIKIISINRTFPGRKIDSPFVSKNIAIGKPCIIMRGAIVGDGVRLGNNTMLCQDCRIINGASLGDYSYANIGTQIISGSIGKFCSIGYRCIIGGELHPTQYISTSPYLYGSNNILQLPCLWDDIESPPIIGNDVWIGANATIMQGINISDGAVVAAGAIVTKDVPPYSIVAGTPAKIIKYRFDENTIEYLLKLKWWDLLSSNDDELRRLIEAKDQWLNSI